MERWWLGPRSVSLKENLAIELEIGDYKLCSDSPKGSFFISPRRDEALFVFGYLLPRLDRNLSTEPASILRYSKEKGESWIDDFKGIFTVIIMRGSAIAIYNDRFGLSTFFYAQSGDSMIASSSVSLVKPFTDQALDPVNIYQYMLLNYFIQGHTVFRDIRFAGGGTHIRFHSGEYRIETWFQLEDFLQNPSGRLSGREVFQGARELWIRLLKQYSDAFSSLGVSQTLTAGLDSRMILAGLRALGRNPGTFTFGLEDSMDVRSARHIAAQLGLTHHHYYPPDDFFSSFAAIAPETVAGGNGLNSIYRSHRMDAYSRLRQNSRAVFFGFAGSEVIRGLFPDRLLLSQLVIDLWLNPELDLNQRIDSFFNKAGLPVEENHRKRLAERIRQYEFLKRPDLYLFKVIVPLHFGQDVRMLQSLDMVSLCPYWDPDYLELLKSSGYFIKNDRKQDYARLGHFRRRKGPFFSSRLIAMLDPQAAALDLGKGYSPLDMSRSLMVSGMKFMVHKALHGKEKKIPNFSYGRWYKDYLLDFFKRTDFSYLGVEDNSRWLDAIETTRATDEYGFLTWTQLANIEYMRRLQ
jgi:hypothetical protein